MPQVDYNRFNSRNNKMYRGNTNQAIEIAAGLIFKIYESYINKTQIPLSKRPHSS